MICNHLRRTQSLAFNNLNKPSMKTIIKSMFRDQRQFRLFTVMCMSTIFGFALIAVRLHYANFEFEQIKSVKDLTNIRGTYSFMFLIWNLFLAWIPYWISLSIEKITRLTGSRLIVGTMLLCWLLFFPNAPYIVTDLLHLKSRSPIPKWYDMMVLVSFAWTGLMLGFLSLYEIQLFLKKRLHDNLVWMLTISAIILCAFGIYLGRFLRWNSWDVITNPSSLLQDITESFSNPMVYSNTFNITIVFSCFLLLSYLTLVALMSEGSHRFKK